MNESREEFLAKVFKEIDSLEINDAADAASQVRNTFDPSSQLETSDARHSFAPILPVGEGISAQEPVEIMNTFDIMPTDDENHRKDKRKLRKQLLQDMNEAMAQVGTFDNINPILRGLGPQELWQIMPYGNFYL